LGNKAILSKNLKYYIERSGKDRRELADIWGFPYSTVTEWINGKKYPRIDRIEVMADYFGIQKSDLIEDKEKPIVEDDGHSERLRQLLTFAQSVPEDKIEMVLRVMRSIVGDDQ
jgi:repressor LexA